ncbi:MAG: hypothetical protein ACOX5R_05945 [bacterium]|jgi:hypothetical protein
MIGEQYELEKLVDYEIRCAKRYRRFISIAMISDRYNSHREEKFIQEHCVRDCDQLYRLEAGSAIVMTETDKPGALHALRRLQHSCLEDLDLRAAVVTFPFDGFSADELMLNILRRMERAKKLSARNAIVMQG